MGLSYTIHEHVSSPHSCWLLFMGTLYVYIIHVNFVLRHSSLKKHPLATFFVGSFSKIVVWALLGLFCIMYSYVGSEYTHPVPTSTAKGTMFSLSLCERNFHNLATLPLPHTIMDYDTICWEDNILGSLLLIS